MSGDGRHIFYRYDDRVADINGKVRVLPGIDVRTNGNQVLVAPSNHQSGGVYRFADGRAPWEKDLAEVPDWLVKLLSSPAAARINRSDGDAEDIVEGNRNSQLASIAGRLRRNGAADEQIFAELLEVNNERCRPPLGESEVKDTRSISRYKTDSSLFNNEIPTGSIVEKDGGYCKVSSNGEIIPISNFIIEPVAMIRGETEAEMVIDLVHLSGSTERRVIRTADFNSVGRFKANINLFSISFSFTGADKDLENIKQLINAKPYERKVGVYQIGYADAGGREVFVSGDRAIDATGNEVNDVILLSSRREIKSDILEAEPLTVEDLSLIGPSLFNFNDLKRTAPIISFVVACFTKEKLRKTGLKMHHLIMTGEAGGGKSETLENVIMPIFSTESHIAASETTPFTAMKTNASSNVIPQIIEEYKSAKMTIANINAICSLLREAYDGHRGQRGTSNLGIEYFDLSAPIILVGETSPEESAIRERVRGSSNKAEPLW